MNTVVAGTAIGQINWEAVAVFVLLRAILRSQASRSAQLLLGWWTMVVTELHLAFLRLPDSREVWPTARSEEALPVRASLC